MDKLILEGEPPVEVLLRRSSRAKRLSLRVSQLDGRVTLTVPRFASEREALGFAREKAAWLRGHVSRFEADITPAYGVELPYEGRMIRLAAGSGRKVLLESDVLHVPGAPERLGARVAAFLKENARVRLTGASDHYAAKLGREFTRISERALMYSWRLIMAPPEVLDYVAAHEVAHLQEMNHSPAFWALVEQLYGSHTAPRRWLREHGTGLHKFRFGN